VSTFGSATFDDLDELRSLLATAPDAAKLQPIGLREVVSGDGALRALGDAVRRAGVAEGSLVTVLSDTTPKSYGNDDLTDAVTTIVGSHHRVALELLAPTWEDGVVVADETTVSHAVRQVRRAAPSGLVSVGSGTLTDIAKVVASELSLPHVVVQTAASVNGFTDNQSVLLINGAKRTTPSRWPDALVVDPLIIANAPIAMTRSGLGDQLSMFTAAADWYLADAVGFDTSYSPTLVSMMRDGIATLLSQCAQLGRGEPEAVSNLAECLTKGGLAMGVAGRTAPSSGLEHAISHLLEMHADAHAQPSASHGSQVGAASVFAALVWRRVQRRLAEGNVTLSEENVATRERVLAAFTHLDATGATAEECWRLYERKATWIREHLDDLSMVVNDWPAHASEIDGLLAPVETVIAALHDAGAPTKFDQLNPCPEHAVVEWAVTNAHLMRDRFGVLDLANLIGAWSYANVTDVLDEMDGLST
jgi:glycerol-1-phosphate dehydrogenase [NAD(P)+]